MESTEETAFLAGIRAEPKDDLRRLVYADWLDERGDDESRTKAEYLRLEVHVSGLADDHPERDGHILTLRDVAERLPMEWKTWIAKAPIENCGVLWRFQCPNSWDQLMPTAVDSEIAFCSACQRHVYYCKSVDFARHLAERYGYCVVIDLGARRTPGDMDMLRTPPELVARDDGMTMGILFNGQDDFLGGHVNRTTLARPGFFRRVWRKLTGR